MTRTDDDRAQWMSTLASALPNELAARFEELPEKPEFTWLKKPEHGAVLLRGRISGDGAPFHFGEMTVTRCSVALADGLIGIAYVPGRSKRHAMIAAILDALLQRSAEGRNAARRLVDDLAHVIDMRRREATAKTRQSEVDFTMTATE